MRYLDFLADTIEIAIESLFFGLKFLASDLTVTIQIIFETPKRWLEPIHLKQKIF